MVYEAAGRTGLAAPGQLHRAGGQDNLGEKHPSVHSPLFSVAQIEGEM